MSVTTRLLSFTACALLAAPAAGLAEMGGRSDPERVGGDSAHVGAHDERASAGQEDSMPDGAANGYILVKFEEGVSPERIATINRRLGTTYVQAMLDGSLILVRAAYPGTTSQIIDAYAATEGVEYAEPDRVITLDPPPQDDAGRAAPGGSLPPPNEDGSAPLIPLPGID